MKKTNNVQLENLLKKAKKVVQEMDEIKSESKADIDKIEEKIDKSIKTVEKIYADLDRIEKEGGDEIDQLILGQAKDLAR